MKALTVRVDDEIYQKLRKIAFDQETSISSLISTAISHYIGSHISTNNPGSKKNPESESNFDDISF